MFDIMLQASSSKLHLCIGLHDHCKHLTSNNKSYKVPELQSNLPSTCRLKTITSAPSLIVLVLKPLPSERPEAQALNINNNNKGIY